MRIAVGMSGGVDSSVAALLLRRAGHEVVGLFLRNGVEAPEEGARTCCSVGDARDAREVAHRLGVPFYAFDFSGEFGSLIDGFVGAYRSGLTPNPCARCNREIKFGALFDLARDLGAERVATGHYARVEEGGSGPRLRRGADRGKDQSYQMFAVPRGRLARVLLPIGGLRKEEVRALAREAGLPVADKADSQEICFVPGGDYRALLRERGLRPEPGPIVDRAGTVLGRHEGVSNFTVGQRRGLPASPDGPRFVVALEPRTSTVVAGSREEASVREFSLRETNWIGRTPPEAGERFEAVVQVRSRHAGVPGEVEGRERGRAAVRLARPEPGVCPGQAAVFYEGDLVLGGGWIEPPSASGGAGGGTSGGITPDP